MLTFYLTSRAQDTGVNALVLLDTAGWTVVQSMGFTERIGIAEGRPQADSSGTALIVFDHRRAEVFDLIEGRLVRRTLIENGDPGAWLGAVDVTPDGTAIALWTEPGLLQLSRPDGREEAIEVPSGYTRLAVSPDSHRGVLSVDMLGVGPETPVMGIDLEASRVLWEHHHGVAFADFVRGGKAIAATTVRGWWWLGPLLLHPESGVPIGPPGDTTWGLFYFAPPAGPRSRGSRAGGCVG